MKRADCSWWTILFIWIAALIGVVAMIRSGS